MEAIQYRLAAGALVAVLLSAGCAETHPAAVDGSAEGGPRSCDLTIGSVHTCTDYSNVPSEEPLRSSCEHPPVPDGGPPATGVWSAAPCARAGAVGGCQVVSTDITVTDWFYGTISADTVRNTCEMNGGTFVTP